MINAFAPCPFQCPAALQPQPIERAAVLRASQGQALRVAAKDAASAGRRQAPCARRLRGLAVGTWKNARGAGRGTKEWTQRSEGLMFAEQVELPTVVVTFWRDGSRSDGVFGLRSGSPRIASGDLHQRIGNVSGGFIGDGVFSRRLGCALASSSWSLRAYSSISSFMRSSCLSMTTVSKRMMQGRGRGWRRSTCCRC